ncbi:MAG: hypothetical protein EB120_03500 [Proteobacteria bacterium]|nr:hypothetical protein [Pseudomonadota bacterium]NDG26226.1 hypothetical protein [Pseudomonadota bacterium]
MNELSAALPSKLTEMPAERSKPKNTLGKDDFLKLLMAQLNNQDPLKPMEHQEFSAQLAQFGSLEQLQNIHKGIENLQGGMGNESKLSAIGMIGKQVHANGNEVNLVEGQAINLTFSKKEGINPVQAQIYSESGKVVRELDIDPRTKNGEISWDGKDQEGKALPSGKYTFRVQGVGSSGQAEELGAELSGRVTAVEMNGNNPVLVVQTASGTSKLELNKVNTVTQDSGSNSKESLSPKLDKSKASEAKTIANNLKGLSSAENTNESEGTTAVKSASNSIPVDISEVVNVDSSENESEEGIPWEDQWRGFPAFASPKDLRP